MEMVITHPETVDPYKLSFKNKQDLPSKKNVLDLYHFFRNTDKTSSKFVIAEK
jgi:hypothetical protein